VWAATDVAAGEEAFISYGDERTNDSLMVRKLQAGSSEFNRGQLFVPCEPTC
jgi:hypothetical protein